MALSLKSVTDLGVSEAYQVLAERFGCADLPPLDAIENEDWGRDYLLSRFWEVPPDQLARAGFRLDDGAADEPPLTITIP